MLHPHTELRYVSDDIGYGIFATEFIPRGTVTWVKDALDRVISRNDIARFDEANLENLLKYTYRNKDGDYVFCWDLTRFVNHSYEPNTMITGFGFEVAIRDIKVGDELTNDYGTLNIIEPFKCANGPHEREFVKPDDLVRFAKEWDLLILVALKCFKNVGQPLQKFLSQENIAAIDSFLNDSKNYRSIFENYYKAE